MLEYIPELIGGVGSAASIISLFWNGNSLGGRLQAVVTLLLFGTLLAFTYAQSKEIEVRQAELNRIRNIERQATYIQSKYSTLYDNLQFIHAAFALLEKNRDTFPATYQRAVKLCETHGCLEDAKNVYRISDVADSMRGMLTGVGTTSTD